jgi:DNA mismatch endonuclease (patch repair protein)
MEWGSSGPPSPPSGGTRERMQKQQRSDTGPELALRRALFRSGLRFRVQVPIRELPRHRIDIAFTGPRVALFVDGCFWHGCPIHGSKPKSNAAWWATKIERNRARDHRTALLLAERGWKVIRVWEHDINKDLHAVTDRVVEEVDSRRSLGRAEGGRRVP